MGLSRQHDISMLVLELQELTTSDEHTSKVATNRNDRYSVMAPTNSTLKKEPLKRMKSKQETANAATTVQIMK